MRDHTDSISQLWLGSTRRGLHGTKSTSSLLSTAPDGEDIHQVPLDLLLAKSIPLWPALQIFPFITWSPLNSQARARNGFQVEWKIGINKKITWRNESKRRVGSVGCVKQVELGSQEIFTMGQFPQEIQLCHTIPILTTGRESKELKGEFKRLSSSSM